MHSYEDDLIDARNQIAGYVKKLANGDLTNMADAIESHLKNILLINKALEPRGLN